MAYPFHTFYERNVYFRHQENHVRNANIQQGEFYQALSLLETNVGHETVAFPVRFEAIKPSTDPSASMGTLAMRMVVLNERFQDVKGSIPGTLQDGAWELNRSVALEEGLEPVNKGYLLYALPNHPYIVDGVPHWYQ